MRQKLIPFKKEHLDIMAVRDHERSIYLRVPDMVSNLENTIAMTGVVDGRVVCSFGVAPYYGTLADVWMIPSIYMEEYAARVARGAHRFLNGVQSDMGIKRMETCCLIDGLHDRWMAFLGFQEEGIKRQYYNGTDYKMWGKVWE